ncbi:membrane-targeted effector domain-containing toxin [Pseudomonas sp. PS01298]|uniref:membrane-targeted effector domain-containing toxin n=1 Tax=Pseudomonas sp. PS01298 TaxID=2991434 RepID=UPI00249BF7CE|nr:membrane-targeted effector domain-containing toxin [Pseudomonas sp. PS01298]
MSISAYTPPHQPSAETLPLPTPAATPALFVSPAPTPQPSEDADQTPTGRQRRSPTDTSHTGLSRSLADNQNLRTLGQKLNEIAARLGVNTTPQAIISALTTALMDIHPASTYASQVDTASTLEDFITDYGLKMPNSHFSLTALADAVLDRSMEHPLGNFGGALSWPVPLSSQAQRSLMENARLYVTEHPNPPPMVTSQGLLEYLNSNQPLSAEALKDPAKALEALLGTARAQGLGHALQTQLNGIATDTSVNDYTLAAMNLFLDPTSIAEPNKTKVAGFDLVQQRHWGKPASTIVDNLSKHLETKRYTTSGMAKVGAYLLLARTAPELLIKDIPANVTYGSPAWVSLSIAAATIEHQAPGKVPNMTFAQVMLEAENAGLQNLAMTQQAQTAALRVWGVVNGVLSETEADRYNTTDVEKVRSAFNQQARMRVDASSQIEAPIPSRKEIALAKLKERFGENVPFEEKLLTVKQTVQPHAQPLYDPNRAPAGPHSLLDIAMSGLHQYEWESTDDRIVEATRGKSLNLEVKTEFDTQFTAAIDQRKQGLKTAVKQMIAQLPLPDREQFEYGKLEFFQNHTYQLGLGFTDRTLAEKNQALLVKTTGVDGEKVYEIDFKRGSITAVPNTVLTQEREREANRVFPIESFKPSDTVAAALASGGQASEPRATPNSFASTRTQAIADAFVEHLDIDNNDVVKQAKGTTTFDKQMETEGKLADFFLDLIPLRSAIVNFQNGNHLDGAIDLGMDIFGFVTAGAGKVAKVGAKAAGAASKALKVAKILGTTVISELNPLGGLGDLVEGGAKLIGKGVDKIKGATDSLNLANAMSREHGPLTYGSFKYGGQTYEADTILANGQRYAYDPVQMRPYGTPLDDFNPLDAMMPPSPRMEGAIGRPGNARYNPIDRQGRHVPTAPKTDHLPDAEYVTSINGARNDAHFTPSRKAATREKFGREMDAFYQRMASGELPARPTIPEIPKSVTPSQLIEKSLDAADGVVFGDVHKDLASFQTLFDNVDTFKQKGVKKLYMEATFYDAQMKLVDDGIGYLGDGITPRFPSFNQLVKKFSDAGIEVVPLDHCYLTRHKDERELYKQAMKAEDFVPRLKEFNYYAAQTIRQNSAGEKWIALVGNAHMKTSQGIPGVAELTGSIGVGVFKRTDPGPSLGLRKTNHVPDPAQRLKPDDLPGDLHIFKQEKAPPRNSVAA